MTYRAYLIVYMNKILIALTLFLSSSTVPAQEEARAAWQISNFDINANVQQPELSLASWFAPSAEKRSRVPRHSARTATALTVLLDLQRVQRVQPVRRRRAEAREALLGRV